MIDVLVATTIMSVLVVVIGTLLAVAARSELTSTTSTYAATLASDIASEASASGCGAATGYGTSAEAGKLATACTFGGNGVSSLGDIALPGTGTGEAYCPAQAAGLSGPACYKTPGLGTFYSAGTSFSWGWANAADAPDLAAISNGQAVQSPPDELVTKAVVAWRDKGTYQESSRTEISAPPAVLTTGWASGGMGAVVVQVPKSGPVGLIVHGWPSSDPGPIVTASCANGPGCYAVFAYVPAGSDYQVWTGQSSDVSGQFSVTGGQWSTAQ